MYEHIVVEKCVSDLDSRLVSLIDTISFGNTYSQLY